MRLLRPFRALSGLLLGQMEPLDANDVPGLAALAETAL